MSNGHRDPIARTLVDTPVIGRQPPVWQIDGCRYQGDQLFPSPLTTGFSHRMILNLDQIQWSECDMDVAAAAAVARVQVTRKFEFLPPPKLVQLFNLIAVHKASASHSVGVCV